MFQILKNQGENKFFKFARFFFCKQKKVQTFIYIMNDKHSVRPEKEYRLIHESKYEFDEKTQIEKRSLIKYGKFLIIKKNIGYQR